MFLWRIEYGNENTKGTRSLNTCQFDNMHCSPFGNRSSGYTRSSSDINYLRKQFVQNSLIIFYIVTNNLILNYISQKIEVSSTLTVLYTIVTQSLFLFRVFKLPYVSLFCLFVFHINTTPVNYYGYFISVFLSVNASLMEQTTEG